MPRVHLSLLLALSAVLNAAEPSVTPIPTATKPLPGVATQSAAVSRASFPPVSWEVVPRNFHADNEKGTFTKEQVAWIAANHRLICLEKKHGFGKYGNSQDAFTIDAARIKAKNPHARVLFYVNTIIAYRFFKEDGDLKKNPQWLVHDKKGNLVEKKHWRLVGEGGKEPRQLVGTGTNYLDIRKPEVRDWLTDIAAKMCAGGGADGIFLDGSSQATGKSTLGAMTSAAGKEEFRQAMLLMLGLFRKKLGPDKIMLLNGADAGEETADVAQYGKLCDGIYMEPFLGYKERTREIAAEHIRTLEEFGAQGKMVVAKGWPDRMEVCHQIYPKKAQGEKERLAKANIGYPLACFLLGAGNHAYFAYSWWYDEKDGWLLEYPELQRPLGRPLGACVKDGWRYTRAFEHAKVSADLEAGTANIAWDPAKK
jgi:hypothetical protein